MEDYYKILGVDENASQDDIKKAYRTKAKEHHPDTGGNDDEFKKVNEANSILSDENERKNYDFKRKNPNHQNFNMGMGFNDIVNDLMRRRQEMDQESRVIVPLSLLEVLTGATKKINFTRKNICTVCRGSGKEKTETCPVCGGSGMRVHRIQRGNMYMENMSPCPNCNASGQVSSGPSCKACNGNGYHEEPQELDIAVPVGIPYGVALRLEGRGHNGKALNVIFKPEDSDVFERVGDDLVGELMVSYPDLILGVEKIIPTVDTSIKFKVKEYSKPGDQIKLKGQGLPNYHHQGRGDLYFVLKMKEVTNLTPEEENLLKTLSQSENFLTHE